MDGRASQYVAHLSAQNCRVEMVHGLRDAMVSLLNQFRNRNGGKMPAHIIVYRDGVSDGQFDQVYHSVAVTNCVCLALDSIILFRPGA